VKPRSAAARQQAAAVAAATAAAAAAAATAAPPAPFRDAAEFAGVLEELQRAYYAAARGPAAHHALATFLLVAMPGVLQEAGAARAAQGTARALALQAALDAARNEASEAQSRATMLDAQLAAARGEAQAVAMTGAASTSRAGGLEARAVAAEARVRDVSVGCRGDTG
jgi:hypothetical protein